MLSNLFKMKETMYKDMQFMMLVCFLFILFTTSAGFCSGEEDAASCNSDQPPAELVDFYIRLGQGGFNDSRSPVGALGGGQMTLDIKLKDFPIALSLSSEYYTNSPEPTHTYEISDLFSLNMLYMNQVLKIKRARYWFGGGIGWLAVPKSEAKPNARIKNTLYNLETGVDVRLYWKLGFYGMAKYLYSQRRMNDQQVIDFNEHIILLGLSFQFSL